MTNAAVALKEFGGPEVLRIHEVAKPTAGRGELTIRVAAAAVNPTDMLLRSGAQAAGLKETRIPYIPGLEFAGHVAEVGPGVDGLEVGDLVMGIVDPRRPEGGAQAKYIRVPRDSVVLVPPGFGAVEAATVPMNGLTALMVLEAAALSPGDTLLVTGGAGALGGYVIQLASRAGIYVIADAKDTDRELLHGLGATELVPRGAGMAEAVKTKWPDGVDVVLDAALLGEAAQSLVRDGGTFVTVRSENVASERFKHRNVLVLDRVRDQSALLELADLMASEVLTPRIAGRLPARAAAEAHKRLAKGGLRGRLVLTFDDNDLVDAN